VNSPRCHMGGRTIRSVATRPAVVVAIFIVVGLIGGGILALSRPADDGAASPSPSSSRTPWPTPRVTPTDAAATTSSSPTATPTAGPLDLANLEWQTLTEPFGGKEVLGMDGAVTDADDRVIVWGSRLEQVAVGHRVAVPYVWITHDGETWSESALSGVEEPMTIVDLVAGPRGLVVVGHIDDLVSALWSRDGETWQRAAFVPQPAFEEDDVRAVAAGPSGFLAVGQVWPEGAQAWFSHNGLQWERVGSRPLPKGRLHDVVSQADGSFLAVGTDESGRDWNAMAWRISADGREWLRAPAQEALNGPQDDSLMKIWRSGAGVLARGLEEDAEQRRDCIGQPDVPVASLQMALVCGIDERQFVWTSADGSRWQRHADAVGQPGETVSPPALWEVTAVDRWHDQLVAVGAGSDWQIRVWLSEDGSSWQPTGEPIAVDGRLPTDYQEDSITGLAVTGEMLVVTGEGDLLNGFVLIGRTTR